GSNTLIECGYDGSQLQYVTDLKTKLISELQPLINDTYVVGDIPWNTTIEGNYRRGAKAWVDSMTDIIYCMCTLSKRVANEWVVTMLVIGIDCKNNNEILYIWDTGIKYDVVVGFNPQGLLIFAGTNTRTPYDVTILYPPHL